MPRFYFDVEDGASAFRDTDGLQLAEAASAFAQMRRTLLEVGKEVITSDSRRQLVGVVRDDKGVIWRALLRFEVERSRKPRRSGVKRGHLNARKRAGRDRSQAHARVRPRVRTDNGVGLFLTS